WRGNAEIEYFGRVDSQVKLRGMRLELGEVDAALASHEHVRAAAVDIRGEGDHQGLVAYLVAEDGATLTVRELRRYLRSRLPEHMIPGTFVQLQALPLLSSGKVNRKALAEAPGKVLRAESAKVLAKTAVE